MYILQELWVVSVEGGGDFEKCQYVALLKVRSYEAVEPGTVRAQSSHSWAHAFFMTPHLLHAFLLASLSDCSL